MEDFLRHMNSQSEDIKFTMEIEEDNNLPFLDVLLTKENDGTLAHQVYRKKTHTDKYIHSDSHHHPAQKIGVINTLAIRAKRISDTAHLDQELEHLVNVFKGNGYNEKQIRNTIRKSQVQRQREGRNDDNVLKYIKLPYIQGTTDKIANILRKKQIKVAFSPPNTLKGMLDHAKDQTDPRKNKGVYSIPCDCGKVYIGETGRSIQTRLKEHNADITHNRAKQSALAEHSVASKHHISLENAKVIINIEHYTMRRIREAIEIEKHPNNLNRDDGWKLSKSWAPIINRIKDAKH